LNESILKAKVLVEALPYIRQWAGATIVIKYGGSTRKGDEELKNTLRDVVLLKYVGTRPIVVHGGGKDITQMLDRLRIPSKFVDGLRVTDEATMEVVEMVLGGKINQEIVNTLHKMGGEAVGLSGKDGRMLMAEKVRSRAGKDIGFVGKVKSVNLSVLKTMDRDRFIPVIAPIGVDKDGHTYNVNADEAAGALAGAMKAEKLVLLTDVPGILAKPGDPKSLLSTVRAKEVPKLIKSGVLSGGMLPKIAACLEALKGGVRKVHIVDGTQPHALLLEIFTPQGVGTEIVP